MICNRPALPNPFSTAPKKPPSPLIPTYPSRRSTTPTTGSRLIHRQNPPSSSVCRRLLTSLDRNPAVPTCASSRSMSVLDHTAAPATADIRTRPRRKYRAYHTRRCARLRIRRTRVPDYEQCPWGPAELEHKSWFTNAFDRVVATAVLIPGFKHRLPAAGGFAKCK